MNILTIILNIKLVTFHNIMHCISFFLLTGYINFTVYVIKLKISFFL